MKAMAIRTIRTTPADSGTERNIASGISGSRTLVSQKEKRAKPTTDAPMNSHV